MYNGLLKIMWSMKSSAAYQVRYSRYVAIEKRILSHLLLSNLKGWYDVNKRRRYFGNEDILVRISETD